jgi:hypothetical protein
MHGTLDTMCRRTTPLRVVNELIKANKNFDLLLLPNRRHGYAGDTYVIRWRWAYLVRICDGRRTAARLRTQAADRNNRSSRRAGHKLRGTFLGRTRASGCRLSAVEDHKSDWECFSSRRPNSGRLVSCSLSASLHSRTDKKSSPEVHGGSRIIWIRNPRGNWSGCN